MSDEDGFARQLGPYAQNLGQMMASGAPPFKPGEASEHERGVAVFAPWEDPFAGFPEHARRMARALSAAMPVHLRSLAPNAQWEGSEERKRVRERLADLIGASIARYSAFVYMLVPTRSAVINLVSHPHLGPDELRAVNQYKVLYTVWERQFVGPDFARTLDHAGQLWTGCHDNAKMLERAGIARDKIHVIPCPFFPDDPLLELDGRERMPGPVRFYHIGKWEPRKNQHAIIGAFLRAFNPGQAMLVLKTTTPQKPDFGDYPASPEASIRLWLEDRWIKSNGWDIEAVRKWMVLRREMLSAQLLVELHRIGDCYVSLSRGEGFDMPAFDAKLAGNLMLYVPSGGPQDFAGDADERVDVAGLVPCDRFYGWEPEATYYDYRLDDAMRGFQRARAKVMKGERRRGRDLEAFTAEAVGQRMATALDALTSAPSRV